MLPSAMLNDVGTLVAIISQLNTQPACAPVNASMVALRLATHDSGSGWFATPFLRDSFIHYSTPVYPGALNTLLIADFLNPSFSLRIQPIDIVSESRNFLFNNQIAIGLGSRRGYT
jgi:hypothetical protein